ncbi:hypothetical protein [Bradyrhizobium sp. Arg816]|uniref:hypothetical protein n=1 Tax=Bradyrhizobium sp. Arg816 TaxID=2998491 RepID=UPI00249E2172|nr:hypothetical protein [Bradyrhizobium sp. Arg816]MDI3567582.1 hypothetical protein [Bradyrhizobium sp. Arg816]
MLLSVRQTLRGCSRAAVGGLRGGKIACFALLDAFGPHLTQRWSLSKATAVPGAFMRNKPLICMESALTRCKKSTGV